MAPEPRISRPIFHRQALKRREVGDVTRDDHQTMAHGHGGDLTIDEGRGALA